MSITKNCVLYSFIFVINSFSVEKDDEKKDIIGEQPSNVKFDDDKSKFDFSAAWCATANRSCALLLNLLRESNQNDNSDAKEIIKSPLVIQQDLYRFMFISWALEKKDYFSSGQCNPPHKWISKKIFDNEKLNSQFVENPLGNDAEADLNLGKGNFTNLFGSRENYSVMAIEFNKEISK
jgi:hypothetical protein